MSSTKTFQCLRITGNHAVFAFAVLLLAGVVFAQASSDEKKDKSKEPLTTRLHIVVTAGDKDKPVANASVYVRFSQSRFLRKDRLVEMNFKTSQEGTVKVPEIPRGKTQIQVIAPGWKTFGQWYDLDKEEETIQIKLDKPPKWY